MNARLFRAMCMTLLQVKNFTNSWAQTVTPCEYVAFATNTPRFAFKRPVDRSLILNQDLPFF
jgi:hypothetical protein